MKKYITAIYKPDQAITKVEVDGYTVETVSKVALNIAFGTEYYTKHANSAQVYAYKDSSGNTYLSTNPDKLEQNNLLELPNKA